MTVQQHVLNWLYSVLTSEYVDVNRCYDGIARVLARYPTLSPRTDVYTFPDGTSALLVHLSGTLPVEFRGTTYRFPLSIWVPHRYPREPPIVYVTPTETMAIRPGQHVDPQGQVYHPYLVGWQQFWDKSTLQDFLIILANVFAKEPPVVARQQRRAPPQTQQSTENPPPVPPLPVEMAAQVASSGESTAAIHSRPLVPPKSPQDDRSSSQPSLPPLPPTSPGISQAGRSRYDSAPPLPPQAQQAQQAQRIEQGEASTISNYRSFTADAHVYPSQGNLPPQGHGLPSYNQVSWPQQASPMTWEPPNSRSIQKVSQPTPAEPQRPPPDLLVDDAQTIDIDRPSTKNAPPIPPNPEKDELLRQIGQKLAVLRQQSRQQNESSMAGLHAQRAAMMNAMAGLQSELGQLTQLGNLVSSNTKMLHEALQKADKVIEGSTGHAKPDIDELLVAPTVASNQLYSLVAEERALGDAIFMLGRAVERGKIEPAVFAKMTRWLAREWYLKKALARKIAVGMGMDQ